MFSNTATSNIRSKENQKTLLKHIWFPGRYNIGGGRICVYISMVGDNVYLMKKENIGQIFPRKHLTLLSDTSMSTLRSKKDQLTLLKHIWLLARQNIAGGRIYVYISMVGDSLYLMTKENILVFLLEFRLILFLIF